MVTVITEIPTTVTITTPVKIHEVVSMVANTTTRVTMELAVWGMDWEIIWRRVSMSLV